MAIVNFIKARGQTSGGMLGCINYCIQPSKTQLAERRLVTGVNCVADTAFREFMNTKRLHNKTDGRLYYHLIQSFHPSENLTPQVAHEIALKLAEQIQGYEIVVATHCDTQHIHSHFIINSVRYETGKKYHSNIESLTALRNASDKLCREYNLSVVQPKESKERRMNEREYRTYCKGDSWKMNLEICIDECMTLANDRQHFLKLMEWNGYGVRWTDERKYITYTTPEGYKCRDSKLNGAKYHKENMEYEFAIRKNLAGNASAETETNAGSSLRSSANRCGVGTQLEGNDRLAERSGQDSGRNFTTAEHTGNRGANGSIYESADGTSDTARGGIHPDDGGISADTDDISATGGSDNRETGWENERGIWESYLAGEAADEETYQNSVLDCYDPQPDFIAVGMDAAYLAADLSGIIEEDNYIDDCTTKHFRPERKKHHGQAVGGM